MKKKLVSALLLTTMSLSLLAGCGGSTGDTTTTPAPSGDTTATADADTSAADAAAQVLEEGPATSDIDITVQPDVSGWDDSKKIMIYEWDDDFQNKLSVVLDHYPDLKPFVEFNVLGISGTGDEYKTAIDTALSAGDASKYPSIIPADNDVAKYWSEDDSKTANLYDLGFTTEILKDTYDFAIQYGTYNGELKAVTWQGCPGSIYYRRDIAKEVLGSDDPADVQAALADWDKFFETADALKAAGYAITAGPDEVKYAMWDQQTKPLVTVAADGTETLTLDDTLADYFETNKKLSEGGYTLGASMWDGTWADGMKDSGKVFCYFCCPWMTGVMTGNGATNGNWGAVVGPCGYHWGGTYAMIGKDTPNPELAAFLLWALSSDTDVLVDIANQYGDGLSNKAADARLANGELADDNAALVFLNGQNPYEVWADASAALDQSKRSYADSTIREYIDSAAKSYTSGEYATVDDAFNFVKDQVKTQLGIDAE